MEWTAEFPKQAGWYWVSDDYWHKKPKLVSVRPSDKIGSTDEVYVMRDINIYYREDFDNAIWCGPLHAPEIPEGLRK